MLAAGYNTKYKIDHLSLIHLVAIEFIKDSYSNIKTKPLSFMPHRADCQYFGIGKTPTQVRTNNRLQQHVGSPLQ